MDELNNKNVNKRDKPIDEYEYKVSIHEVSEDSITFLLEEVDGYDGFAITFNLSEIEPIIDNPNELRKKLQPYINERIKFLKQISQSENIKKNKENELKNKFSKIGELKLKKEL